MFLETVGLRLAGALALALVSYLLGYAAFRLLALRRLGTLNVTIGFLLTWITLGLLLPVTPEPSTAISIILVTTLAVMLLSVAQAVYLPVDSNSLEGSARPEMGDIDSKYFGFALEEFDGARDDALWAKCLALAEGDESKAKARYLGFRAAQLMGEQAAIAQHDSS